MYDCRLEHALLTYKFTSKERDSESGLDNFGARYKSSSLGRWMSPDAINLTDERVENPANTLNKYVYDGNNPLKYIDPDGRDITVFYSNTGYAGHFWMVAYDQTTGIKPFQISHIRTLCHCHPGVWVIPPPAQQPTMRRLGLAHTLAPFNPSRIIGLLHCWLYTRGVYPLRLLPRPSGGLGIEPASPGITPFIEAAVCH